MLSRRQAAQATGHLASLAGPRAKSSPEWLTLFLVPFCAAAPVKATESVAVWPPTCKSISGSKQLLSTCQHEARPNERSILWSRSRPSLQQAYRFFRVHAKGHRLDLQFGYVGLRAEM